MALNELKFEWVKKKRVDFLLSSIDVKLIIWLTYEPVSYALYEHTRMQFSILILNLIIQYKNNLQNKQAKYIYTEWQEDCFF